MFPLTLSAMITELGADKKERRGLVAKMDKAHLEKTDFFFLSSLGSIFFVLFVLKGCNFKASAPFRKAPR